MLLLDATDLRADVIGSILGVLHDRSQAVVAAAKTLPGPSGFSGN